MTDTQYLAIQHPDSKVPILIAPRYVSLAAKVCLAHEVIGQEIGSGIA